MKTILVVEDSVTEMQILTGYLRQAGLSVMSAQSGEEAQVKLDDQKPDLIVLDVILPGQSGFELCRELKANPNTSQIPIVICSTKDTDVDRMWGNMLGANAYLPKPVDPTELLRTVQLLMSY
ncbi:response regulator [Oculatella sp. LEGE 06141]|uniref:response regulator transcription factor n=1 Tax=Oculatella sp. LEGE 06141 TaxID=1828648 RepID=UPI001880F16D|nr:response regulator [Oculatella sp. LEGE 06141]MBE9182148.1 response regulator [Oculatella sp. LEGE 06141]